MSSNLTETTIIYYCDNKRHLVCLPYSVANLHKMAEQLNIKRHWFHKGNNLPHYDIPIKRLSEIVNQCIVISSKQLVKLIKENQNDSTRRNFEARTLGQINSGKGTDESET